MKISGRLENMDGLRGIAALIVIVFHFLQTYVPAVIPQETAKTSWIAYTPLAILYNGPFSVWVFFVLSGFVVSNSAARRKISVPVNLISRYIRLAFPVLASTLWAWMLLRSFPDVVHQMLQRNPHHFLYLTYNHDVPGFAAAVWHGAVRVFTVPASKFNVPLWTMKVELIGSLAIYLVYGLLQGRLRLAVLVLAALVLCFVHTNYLGFALGALLRECVSADRLSLRWGWHALIAGMLIGALMFTWEDWAWVKPHLILVHADFKNAVETAGAFLIVYAALVLGWLRDFLITPIPRFLGRVSFGVYLVHCPLLFTAFGALYLAGFPLPLLFAVFIVTSLVLGYVFTLCVDQPTLRMIKAFQGFTSLISEHFSSRFRKQQVATD